MPRFDIAFWLAVSAVTLGATVAASCAATSDATSQQSGQGAGTSTSSATGAAGQGQGGAAGGGAAGTGAAATGGAGAGGAPALVADSCNDGQDDNANGLVDEGCECAPGAFQPCWSGPPTRRNVGICKDGVQACEEFGEFAAWSACNGEVLPAPEIAGNGIDEDCDGFDPGGNPCSPSGEICDNGIDDDCDALVDCGDPDCVAACPSCQGGEWDCTNALDDDCDGFIDCVDPECAGDAACYVEPPPPGCFADFPFFVEVICFDGKDNDCDTLVDCNDPDCLFPGSCGCATRELVCGDLVDEDCDEQTDCADVDCELCTPGSWRWCDDPVYCHWGKQDCGPDGAWGTCVEVQEAPVGCVGDMYSAECCVNAGDCCQNYPIDQTSIGDCTGVSTCQ